MVDKIYLCGRISKWRNLQMDEQVVKEVERVVEDITTKGDCRKLIEVLLGNNGDGHNFDRLSTIILMLKVADVISHSNAVNANWKEMYIVETREDIHDTCPVFCEGEGFKDLNVARKFSHQYAKYIQEEFRNGNSNFNITATVGQEIVIVKKKKGGNCFFKKDRRVNKKTNLCFFSLFLNLTKYTLAVGSM